MNQFRIGGVYRNRGGRAIRLCATGAVGQCDIDLSEAAYANAVNSDGDVTQNGQGICLLGSGRVSEFSGESEFDLIPGELEYDINRDRWIPKESAEVHSPMIAAGSEEKLASVKVCEEPKREPLDWNKPTSIDRFPGFISTTSVAWDELSKPEASHSHPLQKMAEGKEGFGSAALLKVR